MSQCARPGCDSPAKSNCSSCSREYYCGTDCQKIDWKIHKSLCPILKKLLNKLQPFYDVAILIRETLESNKGNDIRVLKHLLSYAEFQFGKEVPGLGYHEGKDGQRFSNWNFDIEIVNNILTKLVQSYAKCDTLSAISCDNAKFPYLEQSSIILNKWLKRLDSGARDQTDTLDQSQKNRLFEELYFTEANMAAVCIDGRRFDAAEGHCQRSLAYSRRYEEEGEGKISILFESLKSFCVLRERQGNYSESINYAEECYNLVVEAYDPVHLLVQKAAGLLIDILIKNGNLFDAERYAQITYSNLRDKKNGINQESEEVAVGASNLAGVLLQQDGDFVKAEVLAREALRIRTLIYVEDDHHMSSTCNFLATVLLAQNKYGDETRELLERSLAVDIKHNGSDSVDTATGHKNLGIFYQDLATKNQPTVELIRMYLQLAKTHFEEALRICTKIFGSSDLKTLQVDKKLADLSRVLIGVDAKLVEYYTTGKISD